MGRSWLGPIRKIELLEISAKAGAPIIVARRMKNRKLDLTYLKNGKPFVVKETVELRKGSVVVSEGSFEKMDLLKHGQPAENQVAVS